MRTFRIAFLVMCVLASLASAQEFRATISGHVFDATGAAVPNAKIQAISVATNETTTAVTDSSGTYSLPFLRPGEYRLTATAAGFKQYQREHLTLEVSKVAGIDISLEIGNINDSVQVTAEAELLETQTASRGGVVNTQQVSELPLNARNPFMLGAIMSGVTFNGAAIWQRPFDNGAIAEWSINGSRNSSAEFMLDGASNNGQMGNNNIAYVPTVDSVQEFTVMSNMYNAEYGHTGGGILNVVLKSGTSSFHVTGYEYMRRTFLDANTFQNNAIGKPKSEHFLDQYGFELDGPVYIPKLLKKDGDVKLFYMGSFENYREGTPNPLIVSWPEAEMRTGDFSKLVNAQGQPVTIYNPYDYTLDSNGNPVRQPFAGNKIPLNMINPIALAVTKYMPLPNRPAPPGSRYSQNNLSLPAYFDNDKFYNLVLKFDLNFGQNNRAFVHHGSNDRTEDRAGNGIDNKPGTDGQQPFQRINDHYVLDWVTTVSPSFIVNARASYNRFIEKGYGAANAGFDVGSFGLPKSLLSQLPSPVYFGRWNFNGYNSLGRSQSNNFTDTYELSGNATKIWRNHTIKGGFDIRQINYELQNTGDILSFTGDTSWTQKVYNQSDTTSGDGYASFLLGIPSGSSNYPLFPWWKQWYMAPYFQDDWKVSRRLTLNLGFRWDFNLPQSEKWNRQNGPFDPTATTTVTGPNGPIALKGALTFAGVNGIPSRPAHINKFDVQPRAGFAYQLASRVVMRGGIGLYYSNPGNNYQQTAGFSTSTSVVNSLDGGRTPIANVLSNPFPNGIVTPTGSSLGPLTFVGKNNNWFDSNFKTPKVWSFSYGFQFQVNRNSTLDFSYVGSRSSNLNMEKAYNIPSLAFRKQCNLQEGGSPTYCDAQVPNPFQGVPAFLGTSFYSANTISRFQANRPFPQFNGDLLQQGRNDSNIWYNSLQINYNFRFRAGLNLLGNYTLAKQTEKWGFNDPYNNVYQQGPYFLDHPQVIKLTAVYDLPFGDGKRFLANTNKVGKKLVSGWEWTTFFNDPLSGFPADLPGNAIMLKDPRTAAGWSGTTDWKAYQVRGWSPCVLKQNNDGSIAPQPYSIAAGCGTDQANYVWMQTAGYAPRYTPYRSGQIRKQHAYTMDASLLKMTQITERLRAQFGIEAFNIFNHNYFGRDSFNTDPNNPNFGTIFPSQVSTQNGFPRQLQIRMKLMW